MKKTFTIILCILIVSCGRNTNQQSQIEHIVDVEQVEIPIAVQEVINDSKLVINWDNYNWITEYDWYIECDEWQPPIVNVYKFDIPQESVLYQIRLRDEHFYFNYQLDNNNTLYSLENTFYSRILDLEYRNNYSKLFLIKNGKYYTGQDRVGDQVNYDYPLVGVWGKLPHLTEYRMIDDFIECLYYMEIDEEIKGSAVRKGTYLLKQTGEFEFETISSFPDGRLRIKVLSAETFLITPLFTYTDVRNGSLAPLAMRRIPFRIDKESE